MLQRNPSVLLNSELDESFTAETLHRIALEENAQGRQRKEYSFMKWIHALRPLRGMSLGAIIAIASTATVGAVAVGYMWHQSSVQPIKVNSQISTFQATGCPDFYAIQKDPAALEKANLSQTKKFVLRPDAKQLPVEEQQKIAQAYCEINQLAAYSEANWPNTNEVFNNTTLPIKVVNIQNAAVEGIVTDRQSMADTQITLNFNSNTLWLDAGKPIDKSAIKKGDTLALVSRLGTENAEKSNQSLVFVKLPLETSYYSRESQSKLFPLSPCENNQGEECIKTNALAGLYLEGTGGGYRKPQKSSALQAKITHREGGIYTLTSRAGKQFTLNLTGYKTDFDLVLETGDYLDIAYDADKALSQDSIYSMNVLIYQEGDKFGPIRKYKD